MGLLNKITDHFADRVEVVWGMDWLNILTLFALNVYGWTTIVYYINEWLFK
jgi:hypothetical protein